MKYERHRICCGPRWKSQWMLGMPALDASHSSYRRVHSTSSSSSGRMLPRTPFILTIVFARILLVITLASDERFGLFVMG